MFLFLHARDVGDAKARRRTLASAAVSREGRAIARDDIFRRVCGATNRRGARNHPCPAARGVSGRFPRLREPVRAATSTPCTNDVSDSSFDKRRRKQRKQRKGGEKYLEQLARRNRRGEARTRVPAAKPSPSSFESLPNKAPCWRRVASAATRKKQKKNQRQHRSRPSTRHDPVSACGMHKPPSNERVALGRRTG